MNRRKFYYAVPLFFACGLVFGVSGCANMTSHVDSGVAAAEVSLTEVERLALVYTSLPRCPHTAPCSDLAVVAKIKGLDNAAYVAVKAAERNKAVLSFALAAVQALQSAVPH